MNARTSIAIGIIAALIAVFVVSIPVIYLLSSGGQSIFLPIFEIIIPALAVPLIVVLVFVLPKRTITAMTPPTATATDSSKGDIVSATTKEGEEEGEQESITSRHKIKDLLEHRFHKMSLMYGTLAGFISAWILMGLISLTADSSLGLPSGTLYSVVGVAMGYHGYTATALGIVLHLITGTVIGAVFGYVTAVFEPFNIPNLRRGIGVGVLAGFLTFSALFIPITRFEIEPSLLGTLSRIYPPNTDITVLQNKVLDIMSTVLVGAILFHILYGVIMGFVTALFLMYHRKGKTLLMLDHLLHKTSK
jgi:hypothetical protein